MHKLLLRRVVLACAISVIVATLAQASIFGNIRGLVHDPQHRPIAAATVAATAVGSDFTKKAVTDQSGEFRFDAVPVGNYDVSVAQPGFESALQRVTVISDSAPILHFELRIASVTQSVKVSEEENPVVTESATTTSVIDRAEIAETPGADRSNSVAMITDFVPSAYMVHDQLHIRGGHQADWMIDGVPVPNTNIASNVGPQFDPKDIDSLEVQRGGYSAEYGDRTYAVFNVVPRSGFERSNEGHVLLSLGTQSSTNDQINLGSHTDRFAYYVSANGNRTDAGLETPVSRS